MAPPVFERRGGLGADLDREATRKAAEMASKKKYYAEQIRNAAKTYQAPAERTYKPTVQEIELEKRRMYREKAAEYAKNVPKPKTIYRVQEDIPLPRPRSPKEEPLSETEQLLRLIEEHDKLYQEVQCYRVEDLD